MPTFQYQGRDNDGRPIQGRRLAQSADNLNTQLLKEGVTPITIRLTKGKSDVLESIKEWYQSRGNNLEELGMFARQMHTLTKAGVPITSALRQLSENARTLRMSTALNGIVEGLESGKDLASAMQEYANIFTPIMISMIRVGQNSGHLDEAFLRLNQYLELEGAAIKRAKTALRYPVIVIFAIITAVVLVNVFVIPTFSRVFQQANVELPMATVILISISNFFTHYWGFILIFVTVITGWAYFSLHTPEGRYKWDRTLLRLPIIGGILRRIVLLRFAQSFSVVVSSGIPIIEGISLVAATLGNTYAAKEVLSLQDSIQHGKSLTQAIGATHLFTPLEMQTMAVSEETGELANMLDQVATYYRREVDYDLKRLNDVIEPVLIIALSFVILMLAFAVYLPIWNMVKLVHH